MNCTKQITKDDILGYHMANRFHLANVKIAEIRIVYLTFVFRVFALIIFGRDDLFGFVRLISSPTGR